MGDDKSLNDIKSGKGLKPIPTQPSTGKPSGLTTEQRGQNSGTRIDRFTKNDSAKKDDDKGN